jgi:hypothetical protein
MLSTSSFPYQLTCLNRLHVTLLTPVTSLETTTPFQRFLDLHRPGSDPHNKMFPQYIYSSQYPHRPIICVLSRSTHTHKRKRHFESPVIDSSQQEKSSKDEIPEFPPSIPSPVQPYESESESDSQSSISPSNSSLSFYPNSIETQSQNHYDNSSATLSSKRRPRQRRRFSSPSIVVSNSDLFFTSCGLLSTAPSSRRSSSNSSLIQSQCVTSVSSSSCTAAPALPSVVSNDEQLEAVSKFQSSSNLQCIQSSLADLQSTSSSTVDASSSTVVNVDNTINDSVSSDFADSNCNSSSSVIISNSSSDLVPVTRMCSVCSNSYTVSSFSKKQWRAPAQKRKCSVCVGPQSTNDQQQSLNSILSSTFIDHSSTPSICNGACNHLDKHRHSCSSCHLELNSENYDMENEWHKSPSTRRCNLCIAGVPPSVLRNSSLYRICSYCLCNHPRTSYTDAEWSKSPEVSKCKGAQEWINFCDSVSYEERFG